MLNAFIAATRLKLRFDTPKGQATIEDLWDLPLTSGTGKANLDDIAKGLHRDLRASADTQSFVTPASNGSNAELELKFEIVKHVIDVRIAERDKAADAAKRREAKQNILAIIAKKEAEQIEGLPLEELKKMAEAL